MYEESAEQLKADLQNVEKVAVTTDSQKILITELYDIIISLFIQNWDLKTAVLQTNDIL